MGFFSFKGEFLFGDLQEVFDPLRVKRRNVEKEMNIEEEIGIINREIDEALEFYFKSDILDIPKFSWEK